MSYFIDYWSKELTRKQKANLVVMPLNDKDITTDFEFLHHDNYVENDKLSGEKHQIAFYHKNCLWQIEYTFDGELFTLRCVYEPNEETFNKSYESIKEILFECTTEDELSPIVHILTTKDKHFLNVKYYSIY